jgi:hypothetical protein
MADRRQVEWCVYIRACGVAASIRAGYAGSAFCHAEPWFPAPLDLARPLGRDLDDGSDQDQGDQGDRLVASFSKLDSPSPTSHLASLVLHLAYCYRINIRTSCKVFTHLPSTLSLIYPPNPTQPSHYIKMKYFIIAAALVSASIAQIPSSLPACGVSRKNQNHHKMMTLP